MTTTERNDPLHPFGCWSKFDRSYH
jgi:hypothetical protein